MKTEYDNREFQEFYQQNLTLTTSKITYINR